MFLELALFIRILPYLSMCALIAIIIFSLVVNSAGKSFVAEILMLRRVLETGKIALLVLPYVSICAEKVLGFCAFRELF